jgi:hypothetical protein
MAPITSATSRPVPSVGEYEEWLLDDALDDTFPASDPASHGQPGSIVNMRYAALERRAPRQRLGLANGTGWWLVLGSMIACAFLLVRNRKRRRRTMH